MVFAWVASVNVTRTLTRCAPGAARTDIANGELDRLPIALPSRLKTARLIMCPLTVARNPEVQS